jgi:hypothetical protein
MDERLVVFIVVGLIQMIIAIYFPMIKISSPDKLDCVDDYVKRSIINMQRLIFTVFILNSVAFLVFLA